MASLPKVRHRGPRFFILLPLRCRPPVVLFNLCDEFSNIARAKQSPARTRNDAWQLPCYRGITYPAFRLGTTKLRKHPGRCAGSQNHFAHGYLREWFLGLFHTMIIAAVYCMRQS